MIRKTFMISLENNILTPDFLDQAALFIKQTSEPYLIPPAKPVRTLYALRDTKIIGTGYCYDLWMDSTKEDPNDEFFHMTWREYLAESGYSVRGGDRALAKLLIKYHEDQLNLTAETEREKFVEAQMKLDAPADEELLLDEWKSWGSPQGRAYSELSGLDLGPDIRSSSGVGVIEFIDTPSIGDYRCSVEVDGCLSLSLLQARLNELNSGIEIEVHDIC